MHLGNVPCDHRAGSGVFLVTPPLPMDSDPFLDALRPHYDDALRTCRALYAGWADGEAEDVFQSALLRALEGFGALREADRFRPWFFQILTRTFYSQVRWHRLRRAFPLPADRDAERLGLFSDEADAHDRADLLDALARLAPKKRAALLLLELAGFSVAEIAEIQGDRSASAVKSRLARARQRARATLDAAPAL